MKSSIGDSEEYMTVGEVAEKTGTTVRTLQFYDRKGLLCPSAQSKGGRRLYTYKDMVRLHQILSLKSLGFSLNEIKNHLSSLDTPDEVAAVLSKQAADLRQKIQRLSEAAEEIDALKAEVIQMQSVDFKKYADIIVNLQMKNEYYWLIKHFDNKMMDHIRKRFTKESGEVFIRGFNKVCDQILELAANHVSPESEDAQRLAKAFWNMIVEFTDGDMSMLPQLMEIGKFEGAKDGWKQKQAAVNAYIEPALDVYFTKQGYDPFQEE
ncbi:MerR family transcriptional regulator [Cuneatibacter caecimuris]|uniref:DNA-binding transcriptional MerR regulator n=2 Tax=Cuneatibacter caecimuris TaxID=1796618 RepID=A0A4Q7P6J0_9FIRM|nr:DNA-binding transcriptional MerR regulator [Cuneatibacter caecimuris]